MAQTLVKLDRRYNGHDHFSHRIDFTDIQPRWQQTKINFVKTRNWFWFNYGESAEVDLADSKILGFRPKWSWENNNYRLCIYLAEETLTAYLMFKDTLE